MKFSTGQCPYNIIFIISSLHVQLILLQEISFLNLSCVFMILFLVNDKLYSW